MNEMNLLKKFKNKRIKITCIFGNSPPIFYTGILKNITDSTIEILDIKNNSVVISLDTVKKIEEVK